MDITRIIDLPSKTYIEEGDYIAIDNQQDGTQKVQFTNLFDSSLSQSDKIAPANTVGQQFTNTNTEITALRAAVGSPLKASTVAQMTDTNKIYVYTGSESGYTAGNWYYYNGTAWASGGVYNSIAIETDKTLTVSDMAADAKVVGDDITDLKSEINQYLLLGVIVENSYVKTDGGFANYSGWSRTDYIDISEFCAIKMKSSIRSVYNVFYDANKDPIISFTYGTSDTDVMIPSNAKYMVLSNTSSGLSNTTGKYTRKSDRIDAIENNLNELIEIKTSTRAGYYGSGGAFIDEQDPTMLEVSTYPIDVEPNQVLKFSIKYPQLQSTWGAYCIYEKDGTFISRTVFMNDYYQVFKGEITIPSDAYHIIFMFRSYGTAVFKLSSVAEVIDIYDTAKDNNDFISIPLTYTNGYIDPYGGYAVPTSAKEVYTNKIPVVAGMKLKVGLKFTKPQANWFCYCCYDRSGNFISRTLIAQYTWVDFSTEITVPQNACEILFTFRTYDDATFKVYYESLYKVIADINKYKDYMDVPVNPVILQ